MFPLMLGSQSSSQMSPLMQVPMSAIQLYSGLLAQANGRGTLGQQQSTGMSSNLNSASSSPILGGQAAQSGQSSPLGMSSGAPSISSSDLQGQQWQQLISMLLQKMGISGGVGGGSSIGSMFGGAPSIYG